MAIRISYDVPRDPILGWGGGVKEFLIIQRYTVAVSMSWADIGFFIDS